MPFASSARYASAASADTLHFGAFLLDRQRQLLWSGDTAIELRPKTWELLLHLLSRPGELLTVDELMEALWPAQDVTPKALTNRIVELRRALGDDPEQPRVIQTLYRRGYRLIAPVSLSPQLAAPWLTATPSVAVPASSAPSPSPAPAGRSADRTGAGRCFVGRTAELARLQACADAALQGRRQLMLIGGEAGLGKSALVDAFLATAALPGALIGRAVCVEQASEREAFGPWLSMLADLAAGPGGAQVVLLLRRCAPSWLVQLPWLLSTEEASTLRSSLQGTTAGRMLREACALLEALSQLTPLLLVLEDLHWSDAASIDLLAHVAQGRGPARLLVLATARLAEAEARSHPYAAAARRLAEQGQASQLPLPPLAPEQVVDCMRQRFGVEVSDCLPLRALVQQQSEGLPLFVNATLDHLAERGWLAWQQDRWALTVEPERLNLGLPEQMRRTIEARLALLGDEPLQVLQAASVVGLRVPLPLLQAALQWPAEQAQSACDALVRGPHLLRAWPAEVWPGGMAVPVYGFVHDVYRRVLEGGLNPAARQTLHGRVAQALEAGWQGHLPQVAGALAHAYERAAQPAAAARVLEMAAGVAAQRFAFREAADAIAAALRQVQLVPPGESRDRNEFRLQLALANLRGVTRGHARADQRAAYERAYELAARLGEPRDELRSCMGLCITSVLGGSRAQALRWGARVVELADAQLPTLRSAAYCYAGLAELAAGALPRALRCFDVSLSLQPEPGIPVLLDVHALAGTQRAWALALAGRAAAAVTQIEATLAHCRRVAKPQDLAQNLYWMASTWLLLGQTERAVATFHEVQRLAEELDMQTYRILCRVGLQAALPVDQRSDELGDAARAHQLQGEDCYSLPLLLLLAETRLARGNREGAGQALQDAARLTCGNGCYEGERLRLQAACLADDESGAINAAQDGAVRSTLLAAIQVNLDGGLLTFALRACTALRQYARARGDAEAEADRLFDLLERCSDGLETPDVREARAALALSLAA